MRADHVLHRDGEGEYHLECLPGPGHFTANLEEWTADADELEANGVRVDRTRCWVHDWVENSEPDWWMKGDDWPGEGPWPVVCSFAGGLDVERVTE